MRALALTTPQRLVVAFASALAATPLYVMASAKAHSSHPYPNLGALFHPWESPLLTVTILGLCWASWKVARPIFRTGSVLQRIAAAVALGLPTSMVAHLVLVLARVAVWSVRELTTV